MHRYIRNGLLGCLLFVSLCRGGDKAWRSRLYPENWKEGGRFGGHSLPDFSYAGYRNQTRPLPTDPPGKMVTVVADRTGKSDATAMIQDAIDQASQTGGIVCIPDGLYRCDGQLTVASPGVVIRGTGETKIFFTKYEGMKGRGHILFRGKLNRSGEVLLTRDGQAGSNQVVVADAGSFKVGDHVCIGWIISNAFVKEHQMTGIWKSFNGKWRAIFRRKVVATEGNRVTLDIPLRYRALVRDSASLRKESGYLTECGVENLSIANAVAWADAWKQVRVAAIDMRCARDCWIREVKSFPSPLAEAKGFHLQSGGIRLVDCKAVTIRGCTMAKAQNRGGGGCGYLFEISRCGEVLTRDCGAVDGRHNFIQNWDFGTSGCVWLRCTSRGSRNVVNQYVPIGIAAYCEFHHSLAMSCLIDQCTLDDGWYAGNRRHWSSGAGLTSTGCVFWNTRGTGKLHSWQSGFGYIVGTQGVAVETSLDDASGVGTAPEDYVEGLAAGRRLIPQSLFEDQLKKRLTGK